MKLISWNVNGIRAAYKKGLLDFMNESNADIYCFQEIKISQKDIDILLPALTDGLKEKYEFYWYPAQKSGYSGTLTCTKKKASDHVKGVDHEAFDNEGRVLTIEMDDFYIINTYFPNSKPNLARIDFKLEFNEKIGKYCDKLTKKKPVIITGDFNVAHKEIDIARPKTNHHSAGFTDEERQSFTKFLDRGYIDTYREFVEEGGHYTWWSYFGNARAKNVGWRIDYFVASESIKKNLVGAKIYPEVTGSDHCPIELDVKFD